MDNIKEIVEELNKIRNTCEPYSDEKQVGHLAFVAWNTAIDKAIEVVERKLV